MRPKKKDRHLPVRMYFKHGRFWYVHQNKWQRLSDNYQDALLEYSKLIKPSGTGGMPALIDTVLDHISPKLANNTITQYKIAAGMLKEMFADFEPEQVQPKHVAAIKMHMASTPNMCNRVLSFSRIVFNYALENQVIDSNPVVGIRRHEEKKRDRYITNDEFSAIYLHASAVLRCVMDLCYLTAQRIGDVLTIERSDLGSEGIHFNQQKTGKRLIVKYTPDLRAVIEQANALSPSESSYLVAQKNGKPYSYYAIRDQWRRACQKAAISDANLHDMRAKSLTDANAQGIDAQTLAGHEDSRMTKRYIRLRQIDRATPPTSIRH